MPNHYGDPKYQNAPYHYLKSNGGEGKNKRRGAGINRVTGLENGIQSPGGTQTCPRHTFWEQLQKNETPIRKRHRPERKKQERGSEKKGRLIIEHNWERGEDIRWLQCRKGRAAVHQTNSDKISWKDFARTTRMRQKSNGWTEEIGRCI